MFPISDVIPSRTRPVVTIGLIAANALIFLYQLQLDDVTVQRLVFRFGVIPARFSYVDVVTSMFLHADFLHFLGNMIFLWIFGDNVEDRLGHTKYVLFYLGSGAIAAIAQVFADPSSFAPMIGASGAIAGVMGAYFILYPHSRIVTLLPLFILWPVIEVPALLFLGVWFVMQFLSGVGSVATATGGEPAGGVAFWAHVAGFAAGVVGVFLFKQPERQRVEWWNDAPR